MLCFEANRLAETLADPKMPRTANAGVAEEDGWSQGGVRWERARGRFHAFTHVAEWNAKKEKDRVDYIDELYRRMGSWLADEVWAAQGVVE